MKDWISDLKVGDEVGVCFGWSKCASFHRVEKRTKSSVWVSNGRKYGRSGIETTGNQHYRSRLVQATPELKEEIRASEELSGLSHRLNNVAWRDVPIGVLRKIVEMLPPPAED